MSLMDALLFDEYRDPKDAWALPRPDGLRGSGSATDPYDTAEIAEPPKAITGLTFSGTDLLCVTQNNHGYSNGAVVRIRGILGQNASDFSVTDVTLTWVSARAFVVSLASVPTAAIDSMSWPTVERKVSGVYDPVMAVHLFWPVAKATLPSSGFNDFDAISLAGNVPPAPYDGLFQVVGLAADGGSFYFRLGTLALPTGSPTTLGTCRRYSYRFDTVMNDLPAQAFLRVGNTLPGAPIKSRGVALLYLENNSTTWKVGYQVKTGQTIVGSGINATTFKLVHAMSSYTPTSFMGRVGTGLSFFAASDFTVDTDIAGQFVPYQGISGSVPYAGFAPVATAAAGPLNGTQNRLRRLRALNFGTQAAPESFVITLVGKNANDANNVISDCITESPGINGFHESTLIYVYAAGGIDANLTYFLAAGQAGVVRHCYIDCYYKGADVSGVGASSAPVRVTAITRVGTSDLFEVTTQSAHRRVAGNNLHIAFVGWLGSALPHPVYNGAFLITSRISDIKVEVRIPSAPASIPTPVLSLATAGADWHGAQSFGGTGCVTEGNAVYDCIYPMYQDTGSVRDAVLRNNYFSGGNYVANTNFDPGQSFTPLALNAVIRPDPSGQPTLVRITCVGQHYLTVGDVVSVVGIDEMGAPGSTVYTGRFTVKSIPSSSEFEYSVKTVPAGSPILATSSNPALYYVWQAKRFAFENNTFDIFPWTNGSGLYPRGMVAVTPNDTATGPNAQFPDWVIRENQFRHVDNVPNSLSNDLAVLVANSEGAIVESNLMNLQGSPLINFKRSKNLRSFNNRTRQGAWVPGWDEANAKYVENITIEIESVMSVCI